MSVNKKKEQGTNRTPPPPPPPPATRDDGGGVKWYGVLFTMHKLYPHKPKNIVKENGGIKAAPIRFDFDTTKQKGKFQPLKLDGQRARVHRSIHEQNIDFALISNAIVLMTTITEKKKLNKIQVDKYALSMNKMKSNTYNKYTFIHTQTNK